VERLEDRVTPASRLFTVPAAGPGPAFITELDTTSGTQINQFPSPIAFGPGVGLAFDGGSLFYTAADGSRRVWELNPNTGAVIDLDTYAVGSGNFDGLGMLNGRLYLSDAGANTIYVIDPVTDTITATLPIAADLIGGLTGASGPDELIAVSFSGGNYNALRLNPTTGAILGSFLVSGSPVTGAAFVGTDLVFGLSSGIGLGRFNRSGTLLSVISTPYPILALGSDAVPLGPPAVGGTLVGVDFGGPGDPAPTNWTHGVGTTLTLTNLIDESGAATAIDLTMTPNPAGGGNGPPFTPAAGQLPAHTNPLGNINDIVGNVTAMTLVFSDLTPGASYQVFVFGAKPSAFPNPNTQAVSITGGSAAVNFNQSFTLPSDELWVNGQQGSTASLSSFAVTQTANGSGQLTITINDVPAGGPGPVGLAAVAIRPAGPASTGTISGKKYNDLNANGQLDAGEPGLSGWTIYADLNGNGSPDVGEPSTTTDGTGQYTLTVPAGTHSIREVLQPGWVQTAPLPALYASGNDGTQLISINKTTGTASLVGPFGFPSTYALAVDNDGTLWTVKQAFVGGQSQLARVNPLTGAATPVGSPDPNATPAIALEVSSSGTLYAANFGNGNLYTVNKTTGAFTLVGSIGTDIRDLDFDNAGVLWGANFANQLFTINPANGTRTFVANITGAGPVCSLMTDPQTGVMYASIYNNPSALYTLNKTTGVLTVVGSGFGQVFAVVSGDFRPVTVTVAAGGSVTGWNIGNVQNNGTVTGTKFNDLNGNGLRDGGEPGLPGWTIFDDVNGNGSLDGGEPSTTTDGAGQYTLTLPAGTHTIREVAQPGWVQTSPTGDRLFAVKAYNGGPPVIYEVNPTTGAILNSFPTPAPVSGGNLGLALGPNSLFYFESGNGGTFTLFEVNPNTGAVIDADPVTVPAQVGGLAYLNGRVYLETFSNQILVFDPVTDTVVNTLPVATTLGGGLTGAAGLGLLFESNQNGQVYAINPATGAVVYTLNVAANLQGGLAYVGGILIGTSGQDPPLYVRIDPTTGAVLGTFTIGGAGGFTLGLGGDGGLAGAHVVIVGTAQTIAGRDFGNRVDSGTVSGTKFNDLNGNGVRDGGEPGLPGWTIFADLNGNGAADPGEPSATTDGSGAYTLTLPGGTYSIREVLQPGWTQTAPVAGGRFFAVQSTGPVPTIYELNPTTGAVLNSFPAPAPVAFAGPQGLAAGPNSLFYLSGAGTSTPTLYELNLTTGAVIDADVLPSTAEIAGAGYLNGRVYLEVHPTNQILVFDPVTDTVVNTLNVPADIVGGLTGAPDLGLLFDSNASGQIFAINPTTGAVVSTFSPGVGPLSGGLAYVGGELRAAGFGSTTIYRVNPSNGVVLGSLTSAGAGGISALGGDGGSDGAHLVTITAGGSLTGRDFGNRLASGTVSGTKFNDLNGNGVRDGGEPGLPGWTIYVDLNNNNALDGGEPSTTTDGSGNYSLTLAAGTYTIREVQQPGWTQTAPIGGRLFAVRGQNGIPPTIYELSPTTGAVLNSFPGPAVTPLLGPQGLAVGGGNLFYIDGVGTGAHTLYELDPTTGAVIDADTLPSTAEIAGLGFLNGRVYLEVHPTDQVLVFDPVTDTVVNTLTVAADLLGGLTGAQDLGLLFDSNFSGNVVAINPTTGAVVSSFNPGVGQLGGGLAYVGGDLIAAPFGGAQLYRLSPTTGAVLGTITPGGTNALSALGGDGGVGVHTVTVTAGAALTGRDFGNQLLPSEDFGDAPDSYSTLLAGNGPRHTTSTLRFGPQLDSEGNGQPTPGATGDDATGVDDEDGIVAVSPLTAGGFGVVVLNVQGLAATAYVQGWIDWGNDGSFQPSDRVALDVPVNANGNVPVVVNVPVGTAVGGHVARFRISTTAGLGVGGAAPNGEVEDHVIGVSPPPATVFVDDSWVGTPPGADPDGAGPATAFGFDAFATVQQGLTVVANGGTVVVLPGTYGESPSVANKSFTLTGVAPGAATVAGSLTVTGTGAQSVAVVNLAATAAGSASGLGSLTLTSTAPTAGTYTVSGSGVTRGGDQPFSLALSGVTNLTVNAGTGSDTFAVTPAAATTIALNANSPSTPPGDTLSLNVSALTGPIAITNLSGGQPALPDGRITSGNAQPVTWTSIETLPVPLGLGGTFDFQPAGSPTQPGFLPVLSSDTPSSGAYAAAQVGWVNPGQGSFDRVVTFGAAGNPNSPALQSLLRDGQWGYYGGGANNGVFQVAVAPGNLVQVTAFTGDTYAGRDTMNVYVVNTANGNRTKLNPTLASLNTAGQTFQFVSYSGVIDPGAAASAGSTRVLLRLEVEAVGGGSSTFWTIEGLDVRPLGLIAPLTIGPPPTPVVADGTSVDTYTGSGAAPGAELTVSPQFGTVVGTDADPAVKGFQVIAGPTGSFSFNIRRPTGAPSSVISVSDVTGASATGYVGPTAADPGAASPNPYLLPNPYVQPYVIPPSPPAVPVYQFDFGTAASPVAFGLRVTGSDVYTPARGNGWAAAVGDYDRGSAPGASPVALFQDGVWGSGSGTFKLDLPAGSYDVRVYIGDPYQVWAGITVTVGTQTVAVDPAASRFGYVTLFGVSPVAGTLNVTINGSTWVAAGLEVATAGNLPAPATPTATTLSGVLRLDVNGPSGDTLAGFTAAGGAPYTPAAGYGWQGGVSTLERAASIPGLTPAQAQLYRDAAWGQGTAVFQAAVPMGGANTYAARVYVGDSYQNWGGITLRMEGGPLVNVDTAANPFWSYLLSGADVNGDGVLTITVTGQVWVVNGIEVVQTAGTASGTLPPSIGPGAAPQLAAGGAAAGTAAVLTSEQLAPIVTEAVRRWKAAGLDAAQVALLRSVRYEIGDLGSGGELGLTSLYGNLVRLDDDGAGRGWFVDATPGDDAEFGFVVTPVEQSGAVGGYDLLTVVMHELGHTIGLDSLDPTITPHDLLTATLPTGTRRLPTPTAQPVALWLADEATADAGSWDTPVFTREPAAELAAVDAIAPQTVLAIPSDKSLAGATPAWPSDEEWALGGISVG
jgi:glutamine cyclotransferase